MKFVDADNFACPIDGLVLARQEKNLICSSGHNFDLSRQGYTNLLLVQHKSSRDPGDSKEMVIARKRFLETGAYNTIALAIAEQAEIELEKRSTAPFRILDAGCGEGYYLRVLESEAASWKHDSSLVLIGLDISKWAVQAASSRSRNASWVVASNKHPPILPGSLDLIICAFGFPCYAEFCQLLKPGGILLMADPGANHLVELRRLVYLELTNLEKERVGFQDNEFFEVERSADLAYTTLVTGSQNLHDLLLMTPHYFKSSREAKLGLLERDSLEITVDVKLNLLKKR
ncbi:MAG: methyltransferase domain-containing protein [Candidatus Obscuribacterales bacterium]|nr:methyltransferase domain-containing protein [Candidatus Obscuribacterales bacterium]